ncbi:MAG TPA: hypothetical protein DIV86_00760 [Alphaproteobacteria bacterium]|nr:hypothetical protein [Alphaproteobacteria bacterium]
MNLYLKISLFIIAFSFSFLAHAKPDPHLIDKLDMRRAELQKRIDNEPDPAKRRSYIRMLYQTQEYYLTDKARMEMVRETYPEFVKQVEYYEQLPKSVKDKRLEESVKYQMSRSSEIISDPERSWEDSSISERGRVCLNSSNSCLNDGELNKCKFVLLRCKFIIEDNLYNRVKEYVKTRADE